VPGPLVAIFHQPPTAASPDPPLTHLLEVARDRLVASHVRLFRDAGATDTELIGRSAERDETFGERLRRLVEETRPRSGLIAFGGGAVPLLRRADAASLVATAMSGAGGRVALTNNRYSSDICAVSDADALRDLPALPSDNPLPRWLEERAGFTVRELPARDRLGLDLDGPLDLAILALLRATPRPLRELAAEAILEVPRLAALRELAADPRRELLVFGRSGSRQLGWLERNVRCRVRFLAEERGLRASTPLAIGGDTAHPGFARSRPPASTIGLLLERGPEALGAIVGSLADGAILDTRVLMAQRYGVDEDLWPAAEDRYASDLLRADVVAEPWLRSLTRGAADAPIPILLGAHTLVGPGLRVVLGRSGSAQSSRR
jgi:hypothetical protein